MGKYPLSPSEEKQFDKMWRELSSGKKATAVLDFDHFCSWLRGEDSSFYYSIQSKLRELWDEIKSTVSDIAEGTLIGVGAVVATPIVGVVEGLKEGFENGPIEGVKKGFKAMGSFLDDLLS